MMEKGIEITAFPDQGYNRLVSFESWRIAVLKYWDMTSIEQRRTIQKHNETDEVFILIEGSATLITAGNGENPGGFEFVPMQQHRAYNVKKGYWHAHALSEDAVVIIVENDNTSRENSVDWFLTQEQRSEMIEKYNAFLLAGRDE